MLEGNSIVPYKFSKVSTIDHLLEYNNYCVALLQGTSKHIFSLNYGSIESVFSQILTVSYYFGNDDSSIFSNFYSFIELPD